MLPCGIVKQKGGTVPPCGTKWWYRGLAFSCGTVVCTGLRAGHATLARRDARDRRLGGDVNALPDTVAGCEISKIVANSGYQEHTGSIGMVRVHWLDPEGEAWCFAKQHSSDARRPSLCAA